MILFRGTGSGFEILMQERRKFSFDYLKLFTLLSWVNGKRQNIEIFATQIFLQIHTINPIFCFQFITFGPPKNVHINLKHKNHFSGLNQSNARIKKQMI